MTPVELDQLDSILLDLGVAKMRLKDFDFKTASDAVDEAYDRLSRVVCDGRMQA